VPRQCQLVWVVAMLSAGELVVGIDGLLTPIVALLVGEMFGWWIAALLGLAAAGLIAKGYWRRLTGAFPKDGKPAVIAMLPVVVLPPLAVATLLHAWAGLAAPVAPFLTFFQATFLAAIALVVIFVFLGSEKPPPEPRSGHLNVRSRKPTIRK